MKIGYYKHWSENLGREVEYKTFGDAGRGVLVFPSQGQRFYGWEDNGMVATLAFDGIVSLSGLFHADYFFPEYNNALIYRNSPIDYLGNAGNYNLIVRELKNKTMIFCCGRGYYEDITGESTARLGNILKRLGVDAWVDFWGNDVAHDWCWWRPQIKYFMEKVV